MKLHTLFASGLLALAAAHAPRAGGRSGRKLPANVLQHQTGRGKPHRCLQAIRRQHQDVYAGVRHLVRGDDQQRRWEPRLHGAGRFLRQDMQEHSGRAGYRLFDLPEKGWQLARNEKRLRRFSASADELRRESGGLPRVQMSGSFRLPHSGTRRLAAGPAFPPGKPARAAKRVRPGA